MVDAVLRARMNKLNVLERLMCDKAAFWQLRRHLIKRGRQRREKESDDKEHKQQECTVERVDESTI
jgi:hypothetical protein